MSSPLETTGERDSRQNHDMFNARNISKRNETASFWHYGIIVGIYISPGCQSEEFLVLCEDCKSFETYLQLVSCEVSVSHSRLQR